MFTPPSLVSTEWSSGGLPGTRAVATYRVLLFLAAGCARARTPTSWSWRQRAVGGEPAISSVCSCDSTSKRALERQEAMVGVVPTEGRDRRRMSVGLWLWLGAGAQVNIAGEWQLSAADGWTAGTGVGSSAAVVSLTRSSRLHRDAARVALSRPSRCCNAGASEGSRRA